MSPLPLAAEHRVLGRHPDSSNNALLVEFGIEAGSEHVLYKPSAWERPLWDFPEGELGRREVAAHRFAAALGLPVVPDTEWWEDGPHGPGSVQRWVAEAQVIDVAVLSGEQEGWLGVVRVETEDGTPVLVAHRERTDIEDLVLLDALMNNADRKAGHILRDGEGRLFAIDHGVTFHITPKLRTVLWGYAGTVLPPRALALLDAVPQALAAIEDWVSSQELQATMDRAEALRAAGTYPLPSDDWPAIPWPIF